MNVCRMCPRKCGADRDKGNNGLCGVSGEGKIRVARAALHMWEEPCISGEKGSGAVFFCGCPLHCVYCQNAAISGGKAGMDITEEQLVQIYLRLAAAGAHNINLVTGTHYSDIIKSSLISARRLGMKLPAVYNCGGYESVDTLRGLDGVIDVYMPDFKYIDSDTAQRYSGAPDYPDIAKAALAEMVRQRGKPVFDDDGIMLGGVLVRHLLLPGHLSESKRIIDYLYNTYGDSIYISIMNQYTPPPHIKYTELSRKVGDDEYDEIVSYALDIGVTHAFIQEGDTASESFIPEFDCTGLEWIAEENGRIV